MSHSEVVSSTSGKSKNLKANHPDDHPSVQEIATMLAENSIKVRDFAYEENTLPPIRAWRVLQIQPDPRPAVGLKLKRSRDGEDGDHGEESRAYQAFGRGYGGEGPSESLKKQKLERKSTEPCIF